MVIESTSVLLEFKDFPILQLTFRPFRTVVLPDICCPKAAHQVVQRDNATGRPANDVRHGDGPLACEIAEEYG